ncbi:MAG: helical backbone metal receptor [Planctomycetia bacterium]|nr:helical backbone metal receptor [Planctomycetia bacterium]
MTKASVLQFPFKRWSPLTGLCVITLLFVALLSFSGCTRSTGKNDDVDANNASSASTLRIVSTAPSITEALFAIGLGDCVIARSDYCKYPEEAIYLPKIGSLYDYNLEAIAELNPDFVVVLAENETLPAKLKSLGIECVTVNQSDFVGMLESFEELGARASRGVGERRVPEAEEVGRRLRQELQTRVDNLRALTADLERPRTLISIYRTWGTGKIGEVYVAGQNPFFDYVLEIVGAENAAASLPGVAPTVEAEGIVSLNPDVIVDLSTDGTEYSPEERQIRHNERVYDWQSLGAQVKAVENERIYTFFDDYATIPGPRTILFLEELALKLHPELEEIRGDKVETNVP